MEKTLALVFAVTLAGTLASRAEAATRRSKPEPVDTKALLHGPDIWALIEGDIQYRENVPVDPDTPRPWVTGVRQAAVTQPEGTEAPRWTPGGSEEATHPLVMEDVVDNFLRRFREALPILDVEDESELTSDGLKELEDISGGLLLHARELVRVYAALSRQKRVRGEGRLGADPDVRAYSAEAAASAAKAGRPSTYSGRREVEESVLAATEEWLAVVERMETSAVRLRRGALMRSPVRLRKAWKALVAAALKIPQFRSSIQAIMVRRERGKSKKP